MSNYRNSLASWWPSRATPLTPAVLMHQCKTTGRKSRTRVLPKTLHTTRGLEVEKIGAQEKALLSWKFKHRILNTRIVMAWRPKGLRILDKRNPLRMEERLTDKAVWIQLWLAVTMEVRTASSKSCLPNHNKLWINHTEAVILLIPYLNKLPTVGCV